MKSLNSKYIVKCYGLKKHRYQKQYYLILERVDVPTLEFHLKKNRRLSEKFVKVLVK